MLSAGPASLRSAPFFLLSPPVVLKCVVPCFQLPPLVARYIRALQLENGKPGFSMGNQDHGSAVATLAHPSVKLRLHVVCAAQTPPRNSLIPRHSRTAAARILPGDCLRHRCWACKG